MSTFLRNSNIQHITSMVTQTINVVTEFTFLGLLVKVLRGSFLSFCGKNKNKQSQIAEGKVLPVYTCHNIMMKEKFQVN